MVEATERETVVAIPVARRVDIAATKAEGVCVVSATSATRPIVGAVAGVVQGAIRVDDPATYKE